MILNWLPRDNEAKSHQLFGNEHFGTEAPCTMYEKKLLINPGNGEKVKDLTTAWATLNNPSQYGSYTTQIFTVASDTATFGQGGTRHGSTPTGGSTNFSPWNLSMEQAMWQACSNEQWSAVKMERLGLISKALPIKKNAKGEWMRDPRVITNAFTENGEIVYGEFKKGTEFKKAQEELKNLTTDWSLLDGYVNQMVWTLAHTTYLCLMTTIESIRMRKKFFWDLEKQYPLYWLGANMNAEAFLGFNTVNT